MCDEPLLDIREAAYLKLQLCWKTAAFHSFSGRLEAIGSLQATSPGVRAGVLAHHLALAVTVLGGLGVPLARGDPVPSVWLCPGSHPAHALGRSLGYSCLPWESTSVGRVGGRRKPRTGTLGNLFCASALTWGGLLPEMGSAPCPCWASCPLHGTPGRCRTRCSGRSLGPVSEMG